MTTSTVLDLDPYPKLLVDGLDEIDLFRVRRGDANWLLFKSMHYVSEPSVIGRQVHFLVIYQNHVVGAMSAGMSVWRTKPRDRFFGIDERNRRDMNNLIVNNVFFRLNIHVDRLGTRVLKLFRQKVPPVWKEQYGIDVLGFETLVEPPRTGALYKADNWTHVGATAGYKKSRAGKQLYGEAIRSLFSQGTRKLVLCRFADNKRQAEVPLGIWPLIT